VVVSPSSHEYAGWIVGTASTDQDFFLNNGSGGPITVTNITPGGGATQSDFPNDTNSTTCTNGLVLPAGAGCNLEVYFKPGASGPTNTVDGRTGTFTFNWTGTLAGSHQVTVMGAAETGVSLYLNSITGPTEYVGVSEDESGADIIYNGTSNPVSLAIRRQAMTVRRTESCRPTLTVTSPDRLRRPPWEFERRRQRSTIPARLQIRR
jgi:hypothetical protein